MQEERGAREVRLRRERGEHDAVDVPARGPAASSASLGGLAARSDGQSAPLDVARSAMPLRWRIHSSLVSISFARSSLVTTRSGTYMPVPVIFARTSSSSPLCRQRPSSGRAIPSRSLSHRICSALEQLVRPRCAAAPRPATPPWRSAIAFAHAGGRRSIWLKTSSSGVSESRSRRAPRARPRCGARGRAPRRPPRAAAGWRPRAPRGWRGRPRRGPGQVADEAHRVGDDHLALARESAAGARSGRGSRTSCPRRGPRSW